MEPLKPEQRRAALENSPQAQPSDLEEYERLLSLRFTEDPDKKPAASPEESEIDAGYGREARIQQLHRKLFPSAAVETEKSQR